MVLNYQRKLHLVCIKKKINFVSKPHKIHTCQKKCQLVVLSNCIEHEISKIASSSLKKLFPQEGQMLLTR